MEKRLGMLHFIKESMPTSNQDIVTLLVWDQKLWLSCMVSLHLKLSVSFSYRQQNVCTTCSWLQNIYVFSKSMRQPENTALSPTTVYQTPLHQQKVQKLLS